MAFALRVVSGSRDATLRVWDIESGQCLHVLMGHVAAVRCVQYDGRRVVSGAYDFMVKVWDPETETCLHTLQGHTNRVYSLQVGRSMLIPKNKNFQLGISFYFSFFFVQVEFFLFFISFIQMCVNVVNLGPTAY